MLTYHLSDSHPKYYALYLAIRADIAAGVLRPGDKLPSRRSLADHLGVSCVTVDSAYQQLLEEGYITARQRSGYYIQTTQLPAPYQRNEEQILQFLPEESTGPTENDFPYSLWFKTLRKIISEQGQRLVNRSPNEGCAVLRNAIARYLLRYRGMFAQPEQIIVGSGSEQLYGFVVRMLGRNRVYGLELPSYGQIEAVYRGFGAQVDQLPLEPDGIASAALVKTSSTVLHVTPFHSWPSGVTASASKRAEYLQWAHQGNRYIIEDDFDSEFFMPGKPLDSLYSLDTHGIVIYLNTFSRSLAPSMRMGYMILPPALLKTYQEKLGMYSCSVPVLEQYALASFLDEGYFEQHLNRVRRKMRQNYA